MVTTEVASIIQTIALEQTPAVRKRQQSLEAAGDYVVPEYFVGPENLSLLYLFEEAQLQKLAKLSPIVLYGNKQVGKTALAITLAVRWSRLTNLRPLQFSTGESFIRDYASAVEIDDIDHFHSRHRRAKLLVIDDCDSIFAKSAAQNELLWTLDSMAEAKQPVILTLQRLPVPDGSVSTSLISRIVAGYSLELKSPARDVRLALTKQLINKVDSKLPLEIFESFNSKSNLNLTAPELQTLVTLASQHRKTATGLDVKVLEELAHQVTLGSLPNVATIAKAVAKRLNIKLTELRGVNRQANIMRARALAILLSRRLTSDSLQAIGKYFGGRDHSTVLYSCKKTEKLLDSDSELAAAKQDIEQELFGKKPL